MEKERWLEFLSQKIRSEIAIENFHKAQTWSFALLTVFCYGAAVTGLSNSSGHPLIDSAKVLFISLWHLCLIFGVFLPSFLQKGEKSLTRFLAVRDFTGLIFMSAALTFYSYVVFSLAYQVFKGLDNLRVSGLFTCAIWGNLLAAGFYLLGFVFYFLSFWFFPKLMTKAAEKGRHLPKILFGFHTALFLAGMLGYGEMVPVGSSGFFDQLRMIGLFGIAAAASILWLAALLKGSSLSHLMALELEITSSRLERPEDILTRYKEAFILRRLSFWMKRISHQIATNSHEIARNLHEAVTLIGEAKPSESQLAQVEERYKRASHICRKLEKGHERFLLNISFFDLLEIEREKIEDLKDQFSKELRHSKLELSSVRKRIDDKLVALKDGERQEASSEVSVQQVPVTPAGRSETA